MGLAHFTTSGMITTLTLYFYGQNIVKPATATVHFNDKGTPVADKYDDVYFSNDNGVEETLHVFMAGNELPERWLKHQEHSFAIGETGFGTGLNCLVAMQAFSAFRQQNPAHPLKQLFLVTTEKFPLAKDDIRQALKCFAQLESPVQALLEQYPMALEGCHRLNFEAFDTTIDIWIGDVHDSLPQWHSPPLGLIDAWFLDGFAPSKNPDMWTTSLFEQISRLSRPSATFATFTAAGVVKRGMQEAGFEVHKRRGFGRKRDMLGGNFTGCNSSSALPLNRYRPTVLSTTKEVAVIGGGLAAANLAYALTRHGLPVTLYCAAEHFADGASGNPQGGFYPQLHAEATYASQIQAFSFLYASRQYQKIAAQQSFDHDWCGVLQLAFNDKVRARQQKMLEREVWPISLVQELTLEAASAKAGLPLPFAGVFIPEGGWINTPSLVASLIDRADSTGLLRVKPHHRLLSATPENAEVRLEFEGAMTPVVVDYVILATGHETIHLPQCQHLPLRPVRGQVEAIPAQPPLSELKTVLCHKGYVTPAWHGRQAMGSTYVKDDLNTCGRETETQTNLNLHQHILFPEGETQLVHDGRCRASIRLGAPDHQPLAGPLGVPAENKQVDEESEADGAGAISLLTALGSRGLTTAPLMAEIIASELMHQPLPLPAYLLDALHPERFALKQRLKQAN